MTGFNRTFMVLLLVVALAPPTSATSVPDSRGSWTRAAVPVELRGRVHMTAREVPAFPEDDPKLVNVKNWSAKRRIGDWDCELKMGSSIIDFDRPPKRASYSRTTSAFYVCHHRWWPWGKSQLWGPHYTWASDGQLLERGYSYGRNWVVYQVDRAGRLVMYEDRKLGTKEYFDADGVLVGGEYRPVNLDWRAQGYKGGTVSVWLGQRVSHDEFFRRFLEWSHTEAASRY